MRVALISDIHGNLVALDAVLQDVAERRADHIVCLGDISFSGPQPHECVERIRALGCPTVMGNCDEASLLMRQRDLAPDLAHASSRWGAWVAAIDRWSAEALTDDDAAYLAALPMTITVELGPGASLLCAHGSPQSFNHRLLPETPAEQVEALVGPVEALALASGHTHVAMLRRLGALTIVDPGSVGLPMASDASGGQYNPPEYAEYGLLTWDAGELSWEPRRVALDVETVWAAAQTSGMPHADRWRGDWSRP